MAVIDALNNLTSPGWYVSEVLNVLIGVNPAEQVARPAEPDEDLSERTWSSDSW